MTNLESYIADGVEGIKLKPCPFCGNASVRYFSYVSGNTTLYWEVGCKDCGCHTEMTDTRNEAATAWNRRAKARPKGEWRRYENTLECMNCGTEFHDDIIECLGDNLPKFCPECGADMRGDKK